LLKQIPEKEAAEQEAKRLAQQAETRLAEIEARRNQARLQALERSQKENSLIAQIKALQKDTEEQIKRAGETEAAHKQRLAELESKRQLAGAQVKLQMEKEELLSR
jgi:hypothetical protein